MMYIFIMHEMNVSDLEALRALLAERHVTRAAKRIGISQPAMSHALNRLRASLGDPILVRTPSGMQPTPRAEAMAGPLERAWSDLAAVLAPPEPFDPQRAKRRFVVATSDYVELVLLPKLCARLWQEAPGIDLRFVSVQSSTEEHLAIGPPGTLGTSGIREQKLFDDSFVCVVREDHPFTKKKLTLDDFVALPHALIAPRGESHVGVVDQMLARVGRKRRIALEIPHFLVAPFVVASTDLVLTLATRVARELAPQLGLRTMAPPTELPRFSMAMAWNERHHADPAHAWLRRLVADVAKRL